MDEQVYAALCAGELDRLRGSIADEDLDARVNALGWTALMAAASNGHPAIVAWLLERGTDPDATTDEGDSALGLAAERGHAPVVELLVADPRVDVNRRNGRGWTPLMTASLSGHEAVVALLLGRRDLAVNRADVEGGTALVWACSLGHESIARMLAADPRVAVDHVTADGVSPADAARAAGLDALADDLDDLARTRPALVAEADLDAVPPTPPADQVSPRPIREPTDLRHDG